MAPLHGTHYLKAYGAFFLITSVADALSVALRPDPEPSSRLPDSIATFLQTLSIFHSHRGNGPINSSDSGRSGDKPSSSGAQTGEAASLLSLAAICLLCCLLVVLTCLIFRHGFDWEYEAKPQGDSRQQEKRLLTAASVPGKPRGSGSARAEDVETLSSQFLRSVTPLPLVPLCPQLLVPEMSKLQCVVPATICRKRQNTVITVTSLLEHGGSDLFRARLTEDESCTTGGQCGIHLEALHGGEQFAFISTQEVWANPPGHPAKLTIMRPGGLKYATLKRNEQGEYVIMCGLGKMVVFSGDYQANNIQVRDGSGQVMAQVSPGGSDKYEVLVYPELDAGLIIHSLLAIDKVEKVPPRQP